MRGYVHWIATRKLHGFEVRITYERKLHFKWFPVPRDSTTAQKEAVHQKAVDWQREESKRLDDLDATYWQRQHMQGPALDPLKKYAGCVYLKRTNVGRNHSLRGFCAKLQVKGKQYRKIFTFGDDASEQEIKAAWQHAQAYRRQLSDDNNLTRELCVALRGVQVPDSIVQHDGGFLDGDGSVYFTTDIAHSVLVLAVNISQSRENGIPPICVHMRSFWGASVYEDHSLNPNARRKYLAVFQARDVAEVFLCHMQRGSVLKRAKVKLALEFLAHVKQQGGNGLGLPLRDPAADDFKSRMAALHEDFANAPIDPKDLTEAWLAGFTGAEGCARITIDRHPTLKLTQATCPRILHAINDKYADGHYSVTVQGVQFYGQCAVDIIRRIEPFAVEKREQMEWILSTWEIMRKRSRDRSDEENEVLDMASREVKRLKKA